MKVTLFDSPYNIRFEDLPDEILINFFSYISDLSTYRSLKLTCRRLSVLPLDGQMKNLFTLANFMQVLKKAKIPPIDKFIEYKINFAENEQEAIRVASEKGLDQVVARLLEDPKVDPTAKSHSSLILACQNGYEKVVQVFLKDARINLSTGGNTPLTVACQKGHLQIVRFLLADPRLNVSVSDKKFMAQMAKRKGHLNIFEHLQSDQRVRVS